LKIKPDSLTKESMIQINKQFEDGALRDEATLEYIVYVVSKTRGDNQKAATMLTEITTKHPFIDGNKRTAIEATKTLLNLYHKKITAKDQTIYDLIYRITSQRYTIKESTTWIANHIK